MCGRYRRTTQEEELARLYHIPIPKQTDLPVSYNIAPSQKVLTIRFNPETRARPHDALQWGLIPYWAEDSKIAYRTINARAESVDKAPLLPPGFCKTTLLDSSGRILRMAQNG
jgi:putative SOS response-associated peptidase YedK